MSLRINNESDASVKELLGKLGRGMKIAVVDHMGNENCCGGS